ncbi:MAG: hypothetical protein ABW171_16405 [Steroidobacter sp.]
MTATHLSKWAALMLIACSAPALGAEAAAQEPITAVYKAQEISFHYRAPENGLLACHELQQRIANILIAVGARDDIDVKLRNCDTFMLRDDTSMDPMGRDPMGRDNTFGDDRWGTSSSSRFRRQSDTRGDSSINVRIRLMMPTEMTPALLKEVEKDKSRRELVSRVTRNPAAAFNDPIVFAATRQEVTLSQRTIRLRAEDCELLEQMSMQVFRKLDVKVIRRSASCAPREQSRIPPQLVAEALLPTGQLLPMPDPEKQKKSGEGPSGESTQTETPPQQ